MVGRVGDADSVHDDHRVFRAQGNFYEVELEALLRRFLEGGHDVVVGFARRILHGSRQQDLSAV